MRAQPAWIDAIRLYENSPSGHGPAASPAPSPKKGSSLSALWLLNIVSLAAATMLAAATLFAWQAIGELRELDARLGTLGQFEQRLAGKVDRTNEGLQSQFDRTNSRISLVQDEIGQLRASTTYIVGSLDETGARLEAALAAAASKPAEGADIGPAVPSKDELLHPVPKPRVAPSRPKQNGADPASPRFKRTELPNGTVTYRRLR